MSKYTLAVFDLDGTLLNTLEDLRDSLNWALAQHDCPPRTLEEVRQFVGNGILKLIQRGVPENSSQELIQAVYQSFLPYYQAHCAEKTQPYPGILALLQALRAGGVACAVVSNKAAPAVKVLCEQYFPGLLDVSVGERPGVSRKPAPDSVNAVLAELKVSPAHAVYIGDSDVDIETARNAGVDCISVTWGFRSQGFLILHRATNLASTPEEVSRKILGV